MNSDLDVLYMHTLGFMITTKFFRLLRIITNLSKIHFLSCA